MSFLLLSTDRHVSALQHSSPDAAVLFAAAGLCLIVLELNRPGLILPGSLGLLLVLLAAWVLLGYPVEPWAVGLLVVSVGVVLLNLWLKLPAWLLALAALAMAASLRFLVPLQSGFQVHTPVAVTCGVGLGAFGAFLSRVALRARRAKRVN